VWRPVAPRDEVGAQEGTQQPPAERQACLAHARREALLQLLAERGLVAQQRVVVVDRAQRERVHGLDCSCYHLVASPCATR
jgi:hypothetical protein